jgi:hypothetical protein
VSLSIYYYVESLIIPYAIQPIAKSKNIYLVHQKPLQTYIAIAHNSNRNAIPTNLINHISLINSAKVSGFRTALLNPS